MLGLGKVKGSGKRNSSLCEQNTGFYFLILLLEGKIQGAMLGVCFLKQKTLFPEKFRNEIACERTAPVSAAGSVAASMGVPADTQSSAVHARAVSLQELKTRARTLVVLPPASSGQRFHHIYFLFCCSSARFQPTWESSWCLLSGGPSEPPAAVAQMSPVPDVTWRGMLQAGEPCQC